MSNRLAPTVLPTKSESQRAKAVVEIMLATYRARGRKAWDARQSVWADYRLACLPRRGRGDAWSKSDLVDGRKELLLNGEGMFRLAAEPEDLEDAHTQERWAKYVTDAINEFEANNV